MKEEKICLGCKISKPLEDFAFRNKSKGTYQARCRICIKDKYYTDEHKKKQIERSTSKRKLLPKDDQKVLREKYYSNGECIYCLNKFKYSKHNQSGKFCSNKCSAKFASDSLVLLWRIGLSSGLNNSKTTENSHTVKMFMKNNYKHCEICGLDEWNDLPIPLEIDHIDGDAMNNRPNNLRMLCRNCHGQTSNFGSRNKNGTRIHYYQTIKTTT